MNFIARPAIKHLTIIEVVFEVRKKGITLDLQVNTREQELRASWQERCVELRAPDQVEEAAIRGFLDGIK